MYFALQCSASCGPGVQKRELKCVEKTVHGKLITFPQRRCRNIKKPNTNLEEACNKGACSSQMLYNMVSGWYSSPWQQVGMRNFLTSLPIPAGALSRTISCLDFYRAYKRRVFSYTVAQVATPSAFHYAALENKITAVWLLDTASTVIRSWLQCWA